MNIKKTSAGNYFWYYKGYYCFAYIKPHGAYSCSIGRKGQWLFTEGNFGTSLPTLKHVAKWVRTKIDPYSYELAEKIIKETT